MTRSSQWTSRMHDPDRDVIFVIDLDIELGTVLTPLGRTKVDKSMSSQVTQVDQVKTTITTITTTISVPTTIKVTTVIMITISMWSAGTVNARDTSAGFVLG